jgi:soluble lytic murein transglycosylase-like protein
MELDRFLESYRGSDQRTLIAIAEKLEGVEDWASLVRWAEKNFPRPIKNLDLRDPIVKFHYPRAFEKDVLKQARQFGVSPFLIWGVMREESRFRPDVISIAGAVGVMQLMPPLANRIGMNLRDPVAKRTQLTDARRNIRYGAYHLLELQAQVEKLAVDPQLKPALQVAAYNAGIEAVQRWLKQKDTSSLDVFIESIPFQETRGYVKRVLQSAYIYSRLYGKSSASESPLDERKVELNELKSWGTL